MRSYTIEFTVKARISYTDAQFSTLVKRSVDAGTKPSLIVASDARRMINRQSPADYAFGRLCGMSAPGQGSKVRID